MTDDNVKPRLQVKISDPSERVEVYDPSEKTEEAIARLNAQQKIINWAMVAVVVVVTLGFIGVVTATFAIFIDHQDYAAQRYNEYIKLLENRQEQITQNNNTIPDIKNNENSKISDPNKTKMPNQIKNNLP